MLDKIPSQCFTAVSQALLPVGKEEKPLPETALVLLCMPKHPRAGFINFISLVGVHIRPTTGLKMAPAEPPAGGQTVRLRVQASMNRPKLGRA